MHSFKLKLTYILFSLLPKKILSQHARKPEGLIGKIMCFFFENGNILLIKHMLDCATISRESIVLDIGFGPGQFFNLIYKDVNPGFMAGIDISDDVVKSTSRRFKQKIDSNELELKLANIESIPYQDNKFDTIFSANTVYFWKNIQAALQEVKRVLKPDGIFIVGYKTKEQMEMLKLDKEIFNYYTQNDIESFMVTAGFSNVKTMIKLEQGVNLYCTIGIK